MTSRDFVYWLQGYLELQDDHTLPLTPKQVELIRAHINMVFIHEIDPSFPTEQQAALNESHGLPAYLSPTSSMLRC